MTKRLFSVMISLILLAGLLPAPAVLAGDDGDFEFQGTVESLPDGTLIGDWVVSGTMVHVTAATQVDEEHGAVTLGALVKVKGWLQADGSVNATKIDVKSGSDGGGDGSGSDGEGDESELYGTVESLPDTAGWVGDWVVGGKTVHVDTATRIQQEDGVVAVGAFVEVKGSPQADGSLNATKIEVKSSPGGAGSEAEFYGTIETLPGTPGWIGDWVVSGVTVHVTAATRIEQEHGAVAEGAYVEVKGTRQTIDGSVNASKIDVKMGASSGGDGDYRKLYGTIESLPNTLGWIGEWKVDNQVVHVDTATRIEQEHGLVAVGAFVEVKGWSRADGSVDAIKLEVKASPDAGSQTKFRGTVETLPNTPDRTGNWTVSGRTVHVNTATRIHQEDGPVAVGAYVEVQGWLQTDNSVNATEIEVKDGPGSGDTGTAIKFYGTVEQLPPNGLVGTWIISGRVTAAAATTEIDQEHGPAVVDAYVEVEGLVQADGSVLATKIEVKSSPGTDGDGSVGYVKIHGVIEDLPAGGLTGDWLVSGRIVHVDASTRIEQEHGTAHIGGNVEVKGIQQSDGSINAHKIEVKD